MQGGGAVLAEVWVSEGSAVVAEICRKGGAMIENAFVAEGVGGVVVAEECRSA